MISLTCSSTLPMFSFLEVFFDVLLAGWNQLLVQTFSLSVWSVILWLETNVTLFFITVFSLKICLSICFSRSIEQRIYVDLTWQLVVSVWLCGLDLWTHSACFVNGLFLFFLFGSQFFRSVVWLLLGYILKWKNLSLSFKLLDICFESSNFRMIFYHHCLELAVLGLNIIIGISFVDLMRSQLVVEYFWSFLLVVQLGLEWLGLWFHKLDLLLKLSFNLVKLFNFLFLCCVLCLESAALRLPCRNQLLAVGIFLHQLLMFCH